jgi:hypothetical protein
MDDDSNKRDYYEELAFVRGTLDLLVFSHFFVAANLFEQLINRWAT